MKESRESVMEGGDEFAVDSIKDTRQIAKPDVSWIQGCHPSEKPSLVILPQTCFHSKTP